MMKYKGYTGEAFYDDEIKMFSGRIANSRAVGTFYGTTVEELEEEFRETADDYLDLCRKEGIEPEKPFSGKFSVRMSSDLHCRIYIAAKEEKK
jgi:predicted HicB family RNase H-like nuclease